MFWEEAGICGVRGLCRRKTPPSFPGTELWPRGRAPSPRLRPLSDINFPGFDLQSLGGAQCRREGAHTLERAAPGSALLMGRFAPTPGCMAPVRPRESSMIGKDRAHEAHGREAGYGALLERGSYAVQQLNLCRCSILGLGREFAPHRASSEVSPHAAPAASAAEAAAAAGVGGAQRGRQAQHAVREPRGHTLDSLMSV